MENAESIHSEATTTTVLVRGISRAGCCRADEEMAKAAELGSTSFMALYCHGLILERDLASTVESTRRRATYLERAAAINQQFAPIFEALTQAYSRSADTQKKAWKWPTTMAVQLEPTSRSCAIDLECTLLNNNRAAEAPAVAQELLSSRLPSRKRRRRRWISLRKRSGGGRRAKRIPRA
jgi:hypothetical protein